MAHYYCNACGDHVNGYPTRNGPRLCLKCRESLVTAQRKDHASGLPVRGSLEPEVIPGAVPVRVELLIPLILYARKFFKSIDSTNRNAISRFIDPEDFELTIRTRGFTPEDFNAFQSLVTSLGVELAPLLEGTENLKSPQMGRPERSEHKRMHGAKEAPRLEAGEVAVTTTYCRHGSPVDKCLLCPAEEMLKKEAIKREQTVLAEAGLSLVTIDRRRRGDEG